MGAKKRVKPISLINWPAKAWAVIWDGWDEWEPGLSGVFLTKKRAQEHIKEMGVDTPYHIVRFDLHPTRGRGDA